MSEAEITDAIFDKIIQILIIKDVNDDIDTTDPEAIDAWLKQIKIDTIASVLCAHLKLYLGTIIQNMTYYKKKHLFFCHKLNRKTDPRVLQMKKDLRVRKMKKDLRVRKMKKDPRVSKMKKDPRVPKMKKDPRSPKSKKCHTMSSVIAYESTLFTAKEFFQMLKDHQDLIPERSLYHKYMEQLMSMNSIKPFQPTAITSYDDDDDDDY